MVIYYNWEYMLDCTFGQQISDLDFTPKEKTKNLFITLFGRFGRFQLRNRVVFRGSVKDPIFYRRSIPDSVFFI